MLNAISHVALVVTDPARTAALFETLFSVKTVRRTDEDGHDETFIQLGGIWFMLAQAKVERPRTGDHIAFHVTKAELEATVEKLQAMNREFIRARGDTSLYFFDDDNHVFELDTMDLASELSGPAHVPKS